MKHTPGPWKCMESNFTDEGSFEEATIWYMGSGTDANPMRHIAIIRCGLRESEANARLIAAAPELLEALKALREKSRMAEAFDECIAADKAIAKAEGVDPANGAASSHESSVEAKEK